MHKGNMTKAIFVLVPCVLPKKNQEEDTQHLFNVTTILVRLYLFGYIYVIIFRGLKHL